jgi:hypothetical protein
MATWHEFHDNPRISYYLFLRRVRRLSALEAHATLKRADAMVVGLQGERRKPHWSIGWSAALRWLLRHRARFACATAASPRGSASSNVIWGRRWSDSVQ